MNKLFFPILIFLATGVFAGPEYLKYHQAFGIKASNISGYGAFYGYKPLDEIRVQATGIYYLFDSKLQNERHLITNYTIGLEVQKDIIQDDNNRYYVMTGGYYYHDDDETKSNRPFHAIKNSYNAGVGLGYERFFHRVTLGVELGYKYYFDQSEEKEGAGPWLPVSEKVTKVGAGINLGFIF